MAYDNNIDKYEFPVLRPIAGMGFADCLDGNRPTGTFLS